MSFIKVQQGLGLQPGIYNTLLDQRILYFNDEVHEGTVDQLTTQILLMNELEKDIPKEKLKPITIWINSPGGCSITCHHLCEVIEKSRIPIHSKVLSLSASAGLLINLACHHRTASENSTFLLHLGSIGAGGNFGEVEEFMDFMKDDIGKWLEDFIIRNTLLDEEGYKKIRRIELWCRGAEALEKYGFIDEIV